MCLNKEFRISYDADDARHIFFLLVGCEITLMLVYIIVNIFGQGILWGPIEKLFNLDAEVSIPTWFSSLQLGAVGLLLLMGGWESRKQYSSYSSILIILGLAFLFLSVDECAMIHEKITKYVGMLDIDWLLLFTFKGNHGAWIAVYFFIGVAFILLNYRKIYMLWHCFRREVRYILIGIIVLLIGAIGLEILSYQFLRPITNRSLYMAEVAAEEFFEMIGVSIVLYGVMLLLIRSQSKSKCRKSIPDFGTQSDGT